MHRCHVSPDCWDDREMTLSRQEEHHLREVARIGLGEVVQVFDGRGREAAARIERARSREGSNPRRGRDAPARVVLRVLAPCARPPAAAALTLVPAIPKGNRMDLLVEKAAELGAAAILPILTERTVVRLDPRQRAERRERWQRIALAAAKQCGAARVTDVLPIVEFAEALDFCRRVDLSLFGALAEGARPLHAVLAEQRARAPRAVGFLVGPEGDLTAAETKALGAAGAVAVSLGARVLRTDTAALYGLSVLAYELLDRPQGPPATSADKIEAALG